MRLKQIAVIKRKRLFSVSVNNIPDKKRDKFAIPHKVTVINIVHQSL